MLIERDGAEVSLEEVARAAGVGSATLHRHFPRRAELLEEVYADRIDTLCSMASAATDREPGEALIDWLRSVAVHVASTRGLAVAIQPDSGVVAGEGCYRRVVNAGTPLLERARKEGDVRADVTIDEALALVTAIALYVEYDADGSARAERLVLLALHGVMTPRAS